MNDATPTILEQEVLEMLLAGNNAQLEVLRYQLTKAHISNREFTGVGFITNFDVPSKAARLSKRERRTIRDVSASIQGIAQGAGFVLFVDDGVLNCLEGFAYGEELWPDKVERFELTYLEEIPPRSGHLLPVPVRDEAFGLKELTKA